MKDDPLDVRQAIADVALLRRVLHQIEQKRTDQESVGLFGTTLNANMLLQGGALCVALTLAIIEIFYRMFSWPGLLVYRGSWGIMPLHHCLRKVDDRVL